MLQRVLPLLALVLALAPGTGSRQAPAPPPVEPDAFTVDATHSMIVYHLRHFGVSNFWGRIGMPRGTFRIDPEHPERSFVRIAADIKHMDTGNTGRDRFLLGPDFFNAREFPTAEFRSTAVRRVGEGGWEAAGKFTMHGVSRPVTVTLRQYTTAHTKRFGFRGGFECTFTVQRNDYGMDLFVDEGTLGNDVVITAALEGVQRPAP